MHGGNCGASKEEDSAFQRLGNKHSNEGAAKPGLPHITPNKGVLMVISFSFVYYEKLFC